MKCGELLNQMPKQSGARTDLQPLRPATKRLYGDSEIETPKPKLEIAKELGFSKDQVSQFQQLADNPEIVRQFYTGGKWKSLKSNCTLKDFIERFISFVTKRGADMNKVYLSGNLTRDVEVKHTHSGKAYARAGIAAPFQQGQSR